MATPSPDVTAALATLRSRWGAAAPRRLGGDLRPNEADTDGALAMAPLPIDEPRLEPARQDVIPTGFAALDALLGLGGLPLGGAVSLRGAASSGATTVALRLVAQAQAVGSLTAWIDLGRALDAVEAAARGVRLDDLVVLVPATLDEALAMTGTLLQARAVDLVVFDLGAGLGRQRLGAGASRAADRLARIGALVRRSGGLLLVVESAGLPDLLEGAVSQAIGLRLELNRRDWIRLGHDVVGQWTDATVGRSRFGPPGGRAALRILYADGGPRDACLHHRELLSTDAPPPSPLAAPAPSARPDAGNRRPGLQLVSDRPDRPRRTTVDRRDGPRRELRGTRVRHPAGHAARVGPSPVSRRDVPRPGA
jgi:RecA/RadA recombinase